MLEKELMKIGLTQREVKVYLALLKLGESKTGKIIGTSGVSSGKVYEILEKLIEKGLVKYIIKEKTKYFQTTNPKKILEFIENKKIEIEEDKKRVERLLPQLTTLHKVEEPSYDVAIYKGVEGFRTILNEILENIESDDEWLAFGVNSLAPEKTSLIWNEFNKKLANKKIKTKIIVADKNIAKRIAKTKTMELKVMENGATAPISLIGNIIMISNWKESSLIKITNKDITDSFKKFFYELWKISKRAK
jgi:sugar-specific transcriptional regulator TrmB